MSDIFIRYINDIGEQMVRCEMNCTGVKISRDDGYVPRCLIPEINPYLDIGYILIGENPGNTKPGEALLFKNIFSQKGIIAYEDIKDIWNNRYFNRSYYAQPRQLLYQVHNHPCSIIWTDIVKCEKHDGVKNLNKDVISRCYALYLNKELENAPSNWPIVTLGKLAYKSLLSMSNNKYIDRIVPLYHPMARKNIFKLSYFDNTGYILPEIKQRFLDIEKRRF